MAEQTIGAQVVFLGDDRVHELVGVEAALHERMRLALGRHNRRLCG